MSANWYWDCETLRSSNTLETPFYFTAQMRQTVMRYYSRISLLFIHPKVTWETCIGSHQQSTFRHIALHKGHREVKITTETDNEGANRQLKSWGFEHRGNLPILWKGNGPLCAQSLKQCERVSAFDWTIFKQWQTSNLPDQTPCDRVE